MDITFFFLPVRCCPVFWFTVYSTLGGVLMFSFFMSIWARIKEFKIRKKERELRKALRSKRGKSVEDSALDQVFEATSDEAGSVDPGTSQTESVADDIEARAKARALVWKERLHVMVVKGANMALKIFKAIIGFLFTTAGLYFILGILVLGGGFFLFSEFIESDFGSEWVEQGDSTGSGPSWIGDGGSPGSSTPGKNYGNFDVEFLESLGIELTERESNLIRLFGLYDDILQRSPDTVFVGNALTHTKTWRSILDLQDILCFQFGVSSIETGFSFNNDGGTGSERNILEYPSTLNKAYSFLGLHRDNIFSTEYHYKGLDAGLEGKEIMTESFWTEWASTYKWVEDPPTYKSHTIDNNFVPYGVATSTTLFPGYSAGYSTVDTYLASAAQKFGVSANLDELQGFLYMFSAAGSYHGGGISEDCINVWVGLWSATSDVDAERGFDKIRLLSSGVSRLDEGSYRYGYMNSGGDRVWVKDSTVSGYFTVNGVAVTGTLWEWVSDNCTNKEVFDASVNAWFDKWNGNDVCLNLHYGLQAYVCGRTVLEELDKICNGYLSRGPVGFVDISQVRAGEFQGSWPQDVIDSIRGEYSSEILNCVGRVHGIENPDYVLGSSSYTLETWRQASRWQIPYYGQNSTDPGSAVINGVNLLAAYTEGITSLPHAGCHVYMYSYMSSALTGRVINPTEAFLVLRYYGGVTDRGLNNSENVNKMFNAVGLKFMGKRKDTLVGDVTYFESLLGLTEAQLKSNSSTDVKAYVDTVLDKGGIVGAAMAAPFTNNTNHYIVIMERTTEGYIVLDYRWSSYPNSADGSAGSPYTWERLYTAMSTHSVASYDFQVYAAVNPLTVR